MKKYFWLIVIAFIIITAVGVGGLKKRQDFSQYENLIKPRMIQMDPQWMLVVSRRGDPNVAAKEAFKLLFKFYYSHAPKSVRKSFVGPRARWPMASLQGSSMDAWEGWYGIPVSDSFSIPVENDVKLEKWEYGAVAEILHKGSYADEPATVAKLTQFIEDSGYGIIGDHEEEYLKGPGMFFRGNPKNYLTIIRYRVVANGAGSEATK